MNRKSSKYSLAKFRKEFPLHLMLFPGIILIIIFNYVPMAGLVIAFQKFIPSKGMFGNQEWIGLDNFTYVFSLPGFKQAMVNTVIIAAWKIVLGLLVPVVFALLLNEVRHIKFKKTIQTVVYLPYFLSWVVLGGIFIDLLSPGSGIVNGIINSLGGESIFFLGDNRYFKGTLIVTDIWKTFGYNAIVYLAAIVGVDTSLYEAAETDGANRLQQIWHITLPGIRGIVVLMMVLSLGNILNAGFDQVFNLYTKQSMRAEIFWILLFTGWVLLMRSMEPLQRWDYSNRLFRPSLFPHHITWRISFLITVFFNVINSNFAHTPIPSGPCFRG